MLKDVNVLNTKKKDPYVRFPDTLMYEVLE